MPSVKGLGGSTDRLPRVMLMEEPMLLRRIGLPRFVLLSAVSGCARVSSCTASKPP